MTMAPGEKVPFRQRMLDLCSEHELLQEKCGNYAADVERLSADNAGLQAKLEVLSHRCNALSAENLELKNKVQALEEAERKAPAPGPDVLLGLPLLSDLVPSVEALPPALKDADDSSAAREEATPREGNRHEPAEAPQIQDKPREKGADNDSDSSEEAKKRSASTARRAPSRDSPSCDDDSCSSSSSSSSESDKGKDDNSRSSSHQRTKKKGKDKEKKDGKDRRKRSERRDRSRRRDRRHREKHGKRRRRKTRRGHKDDRSRSRSCTRSRSKAKTRASPRPTFGSGDHRTDLDGFISKNQLEARVAHALRTMSESDQRRVMGTDGGENSYLLIDRVKNPNAVVMSRIRKLEKR